MGSRLKRVNEDWELPVLKGQVEEDGLVRDTEMWNQRLDLNGKPEKTGLREAKKEENFNNGSTVSNVKGKWSWMCPEAGHWI